MGLDDVKGVSKGGSSRSSSNRRSKKSDEKDEIVQTVTHAGKKKEFTKERWEKVKKVIRQEMDYSVNEVLNNLSAKERYETVHEAATWNPNDLTDKQKELKTEDRCYVCGKANSQATVEIDGKPVHVHHTVGQLASEIGEKRRGEDG